ncbi:MAG: 6-bladed beta-propeller [Nitrospirae bacterium]|nr:6-bladed beta-propeller [Nitrospirota bacterium]
MKRSGILIALVILVVIVFFSLFPVLSPKESYHAVLQWGSEVKLYHPMGIAWDGGFLYVADTENGEVKKFREDGTFVDQWNGFKRPVDIATSGNFAYVADFLADRIFKFKDDGTLINQWGMHGKGEGEFDAPTGIAVDEQEGVYVTDFYNHRIQKFSSNGRFLLQWGSNGRLSGKFHYPTDVTVDGQGYIYVADGFNHRVQKFTPEGGYLAKWGGTGYGLSGRWPGWFRLARAVAVDKEGHIYVADAFNNRLQKFTGNGKLLGIWGSLGSGTDQVHYTAGVAVDSEGNLYVSDFFNNRILKLEPKPEGP